MTWHVQYRKDGATQIGRHRTPELAIEAACHLIDDGYDVYGIGTGSLTDSIGKEQIARIYAMWVRARYPLGIRDRLQYVESVDVGEMVEALDRARDTLKAQQPAPGAPSGDEQLATTSRPSGWQRGRTRHSDG